MSLLEGGFPGADFIHGSLGLKSNGADTGLSPKVRKERVCGVCLSGMVFKVLGRYLLCSICIHTYMYVYIRERRSEWQDDVGIVIFVPPRHTAKESSPPVSDAVCFRPEFPNSTICRALGA